MSSVLHFFVSFVREHKKVDLGGVTSMEEFSLHVVLLHVKRGEGDLFLGYVGSITAATFFFAGFIRWLSTTF